ncbi:MAG: deoxyribonuclease IV, partial [Deltaproteobacteria bacterium]
ALERGKALGCDTIQIFTKNARSWRAKPLKGEEIEEFLKVKETTGIDPVVAHDTYLINLASPKEEVYSKSIEALWEELERASTLRVPYLVMHPGAHLGSGEEEGLYRIARAINLIHQRGPDLGVMILLETTAGQESSLGWNFEQLARVIEMLEEHHRVGICFDTCHAFAAGYDLSSEEGYRRTFEELDEVLGLERLKVIHLNDSKAPCGSRIDRHEHIGRGEIGLEAFERLLNDERFATLPFIIETPKGQTPEGEDWDRVNLSTLRSLLA